MSTSPGPEPGRRWRLVALVPVLEAAGYDVEAWDPALAEGSGSLSGRRDRGSSARVVTLDAGGRIRIVLTRAEGESARGIVVAGVSLRQVTERERTVTLVGTLAGPEQFGPLLAALDHGLPETEEAGARAGDDSGLEP